MAVSKLTHATANIFMEQSFNDCLCDLGSTETLASSTAPSSTFPTPFPAKPACRFGLPVPAGSSAQLGSHKTSMGTSMSPATFPPYFLPVLPTLGPPGQTSPTSRAAAFCPCLQGAWQCPSDTSTPNLCFQSCWEERQKDPNTSSARTMGTLLTPQTSADSTHLC